MPRFINSDLKNKRQIGRDYFRPALEELEPRCLLTVGWQPNGGIVAGPDGNLWFNEFNDVARFNPTTRTFQQFNLPSIVVGREAITVGSDGNIWFTQGNQIGRIDPATGTSQEFAGLGADQIISGLDGNIWFGMGATLGRLNTSTGEISTFPLLPGTFPYGFLSGGMVSTSDGSIWFSQVGRQIERLDPKTGAIQTYPFPGIYGSVGMTTGPDGSVWFEVGDVGIIDRIDPTTGQMQQYSAPGAQGMTQGPDAGGMVFGPDGNLWFTWGGGIGRLNPTSGEVRRYDFSGVFQPSGNITLGPDGGLWFNYGDGIAHFDINSGTVQGYAFPPISGSPGDASSGNSGSSSSGPSSVPSSAPGAINPGPSSSGSSVTVGIDFTRVVATLHDAVLNPLPASDLSASISWGDGSASAGIIVASPRGEFDVVGSHKYAEPGTYGIKVTITISAPASDLVGSTITSFSTVNVDPPNFKPFN
jgi:streptogramin lyase